MQVLILNVVSEGEICPILVVETGTRMGGSIRLKAGIRGDAFVGGSVRTRAHFFTEINLL